jgi:hypothetical protein
VLVVVSIAAASVSVFAACGSRRGDSDFAHPTGTVPTSADGPPIVREVTALREAAVAGGSDEAVEAIYDLLNAAHARPGDREGWKGAALIGTRFPQLLERFLSEYPRARQRLQRVRTRTPGGAAIKAWLLSSYASQRRQLLRLSRDVSGGTYTWGAVLRWGGENNAAIARSERQRSSILRELPEAQRWAVDRALTQTGG